MRKIYLYITSLLLLTMSATGQSPTPAKNAVTHFQAQTPQSNQAALINNYQAAATTVSYLDGLGRPVQTVGYRATPQANDLLQQTTQYDKFGRPVRTYLPAPATTVTGAYDPATGVFAKGKAFYDGDDNPYNETTNFDNSPLNRTKESFGPGQAWRANGKSRQVFYEAAGDGVRYYVQAANGDISFSGTYPPASLYKTRMVDEQNNTVIEIKDKQGRLVQKLVQDNDGFMVTHYVYDALGRVVAAIQPRGYELDGNDNAGFSYVENNNNSRYKDYVFAYEYDVRGRVARKHVPGGGWTSYVYDQRDNVALEQSALQATVAFWSFTRYDAFGRVIVRGELFTTQSRDNLQTSFNNVSVVFGTRSGATYDNVGFPITYNATDVRQTNYYDTYDWNPPAGTDYVSSGAYNTGDHYPTSRGLMTGSSVRSNEEINNSFATFTTVMHYDNKGRPVQTYYTHHKGGSNPVRTDYEYNFAGEVVKENVSHTTNGLPTTQMLTVNEYDHVGRVLKVFHGINGAAVQELCRYSYDEIGRMSQKKVLPNGTYLYGGIPDYITRTTSPNANIDDLAKKAVTILPPPNNGSTEITGKYLAAINPNAANGTSINGLQTIDYAYHIRGMLRGMNLTGSGNTATAVPNASQGDLFSYKLDYETAGFYDGNIGKQSWKNDTDGQRDYSYTYDPAKRLKTASYAGVGNEDFSLPNISYDKNGNIEALQRKGNNNGSYTLIDNLSYNYGSSGNRLQGVTDGVTGNADTGDFRDNGSNMDYTYWEDGSLRSDANKGILAIKYDTFLKKVKRVEWTDGRWLNFIYDGSGKMFKKENSAGEYWEYVGNLIFKNGQFYQMATPDGRAVYDGSNWNYEFEYRDVWGNLRVAFKAENGQLVKTQSSDYDALGFEYNKSGQEKTNKFKYQKQERIDDFNLGIDMFKFRPSDYQTGRFWQIDPLAEEYAYNSPYALQENKFGLGIELEGKELTGFKIEGRIEKPVSFGEAISKFLGYTDFNDATVLATSLTRGKNAINIDGSKATSSDKAFAAAGAVVPVISGSALKGILGAFRKGDDVVKLRHYTSNSGLDGIRKDMEIKAFDKNRVFSEKAKGKALSASDASEKYGISKSSARNYIEFQVPKSMISVEKNKVTKATEYIIKGNVQLDESAKFIKRN